MEQKIIKLIKIINLKVILLYINDFKVNNNKSN